MFKLLATLGTSLILLAGCTSNPQLIAQLTEECKTLQGTTYLGPLGEWELCGEVEVGKRDTWDCPSAGYLF